MPQHLARRALAAAAAVALSLALAGCGEEAEQPQAASSPSSQSTASSRATAEATRASERPEAGTTLTLTVAGSDITPMGKAVELSTGEKLTVQVTSDRAGELHVHASPEQYVEFGEGKSTHRLTFDKPGQVDVEEHESGALVARLLVS